MRARCYRTNTKEYKNYGARGIQVCARWFKFENFLADMGEKPLGLTIERINNDSHYMPGNCKWATAKEQRSNKRPDPKLVYATINGETKSMVEWAKIAGLNRHVLRLRRHRGWKDEDLLRPLYSRCK